MYEELKGLVYFTGITLGLLVITGAYLERALQKLEGCLSQRMRRARVE